MRLETKKPLITVIVTTYNRKEYLMEAINSILSQTYGNLELIIVDDGSTDNTELLIKGLDENRIKYIKIDNWGGPAKPRNIGLEKAAGEYVAFCDDDDYWDKNKLAIQIGHLENKNDIIGVGTNSYLFGKTNRLKRKDLVNDIMLSLGNILELKSNILSSLMIKKEDFRFDESPEMKFAEDFEFGLQLVQKSGKPIKLLAKPLVYYRTHDTNNVQVFNNSKNALNVVEKYKSYISSEQLKALYSNLYAYIGSLALIEDHFECRKYYMKSLKYGGLDLKIMALFILSNLPVSVRKMLLKR